MSSTELSEKYTKDEKSHNTASLDFKDNAKSYQKSKTIDTHCSEDDLSLEELEQIVDDLLEGKMTLDDLPPVFSAYKEEITKIKPKPREPAEDECCGSGCIPCVWDVYERNCDRRHNAIEQLYEKIYEA